MSYRQQQRGGGRYEPDPWQSGNGWGAQQMWQGGGQGGYGGGHYQSGQGGYGGGHQQGNQGYYQQGPPHGMRQAPQRHGGYQQARGYGNRPPMQQAHQGQNRGVKRPTPQHFNNGGVTVVKRLRGARGSGGRPNQKATVKKEQTNKDECVVLDDSEKKTPEGFCKICQEKFDGTYNQHKLTKPHREKRGQKYPSCGPCGLKFNGDDARQRYEVHLGSKAHMQVVETAELDIKEGQEPEGMELCQDIEAVMCTLCECVFKKEFVDTHCKTKGHLRRITKKKAEAERAMKAKEEAAKDTGDATAEGGEAEDKPAAEDDEGAENGDDDADDDVQDDEEGGEGGEGDEEGGEGDAEDLPAEEAEAEADAEADAEAEAEAEAPIEAEAEAEAAPIEEVEDPAPEPEEPAPEPAKASPVKKTPARRGRGRGRK
ncbi:hypothetical protein BIW11_13237 [Tropilaelaps mercedesae]|uniref:U1-type domain-containing protein n=1 Tax=Tropilaelaps mercedesae TaxID=418985 RepID=A0A1V9X343_9ACAR|nr:hypothetical protein BIW11_13237 [Tropilaelaps mercedesae]